VGGGDDRAGMLTLPVPLLAGLLGWWPEMAVTFIDNHDTGGVQVSAASTHPTSALD